MSHAENDRRIDYIEFAVTALERSKAFYGGAFGWRFTDYSPSYCEFTDGRIEGRLHPPGSPARPGGARW